MAKGQSRRNSRAESCPHVDVNSDINAARQRDTREKSRLGWHIIRHTSLKTNFDRKEGVGSVLYTYEIGLNPYKRRNFICEVGFTQLQLCGETAGDINEEIIGKISR